MSTLLKIFLFTLAAIFAFSAGLGLTASITVAIASGILIAGVAGWLTRRFPIIQIEQSAYTRGLQILSMIGMVLALVQLVRLTGFMIDPAKMNLSTMPWSQWEAKHNCLTAYFVAAQSVKNVPDIYDNSLYSMADDNPTQLRKPKLLGPFRIDVYEYPPPFLLLSRIISFTDDFQRVRLLWFGINGIVVFIAMLIVAHSLGPMIGTRAMLMIPMVFAGLSTMNTLQKGNVQLLIIAVSMMAMSFIARKKIISGSIVLAYATASKIYPGMLIVYLLFQRKWRAIIYTVAAGIAIALITLSLYGIQSYEAFLKHLPGILGGEAFPAFRNPYAMAINFSIPGIVFKLKLFGLQGMGFGASKIIGWIYTFILLAIIVFVAHRKKDSPVIWLSILILATLRSPFLPQSYATFPPLWLLSLLIALHRPTPKILILLVLGWLTLNTMIPMDSGINARAIALITAIPQFLTIALALIAITQSEESVLAETPVPAAGLIMSQNG